MKKYECRVWAHTADEPTRVYRQQLTCDYELAALGIKCGQDETAETARFQTFRSGGAKLTLRSKGHGWHVCMIIREWPEDEPDAIIPLSSVPKLMFF